MSENKICPVFNHNRIINNLGGMTCYTKNDLQHNIRSALLSDKKVKNRMDKLDNLNINNFDIILVDIEGFECEFLLGAKEKILKNKPIIIIEIWNDIKRKLENMKNTQNDIIEYICSLNYKMVNNIDDDFIFEPL